MAEWQYHIYKVESSSDEELDGRLETVLAEFGAKGWELVEILPKQSTGDAHRLIFKSAKPLD